jgi:RNA polymerase sigma factor (sigma-70 family)
MRTAAPARTMAAEQDHRISDAVEQEQRRLRNFIRRRVPDTDDAEDILQDVFYELVVAYRAMEKIEQVGAWLFRVARNRIIDRFRKKRPALLEDEVGSESDEGESLGWEEFLPSDDAGPEAVLVQTMLAEELEEALAELPEEQQRVFIANEIEGRSFKEIAQGTGVSVNTLLSRKRYAVLHLRRRFAGRTRGSERKKR